MINNLNINTATNSLHKAKTTPLQPQKDVSFAAVKKDQFNRTSVDMSTASVPSENKSQSFFGNVKNRISCFFSHLNYPVLSLTMLPKLPDKQARKEFIDIYNATSAQGREDLKFLLNDGTLLRNDSDDQSTTLHNLYRCLTEPKASVPLDPADPNSQVLSIDQKDVLNGTLRRLANPFNTQDFNDYTEETAKAILNNPNLAEKVDLNQLKSMGYTAKDALPEDYKVLYSGTCVASSMEFNLASKKPAEFARYAADLSKDLQVTENFKMSDIDDNELTALYWLSAFNVDYTLDEFNQGKITLKPDDAAIYRAVNASQLDDPTKRNPVDALIQSTIMQLGSVKSYNSLSDIRTGGFNAQPRGLTELEKSMSEAILDDKEGKSSVTYQITDDQVYLVGYTKPHKDVLKDIIDSLKTGSNVIIGITETDADGKIIGGHEMSVVGTKLANKSQVSEKVISAAKLGDDGKLVFVLNDSDDNVFEPIEIPADELIPKVHHAGLPNSVLRKNYDVLVNQAKPIIIQLPPEINKATANEQPDQAFYDKLLKFKQQNEAKPLVATASPLDSNPRTVSV